MTICGVECFEKIVLIGGMLSDGLLSAGSNNVCPLTMSVVSKAFGGHAEHLGRFVIKGVRCVR